MIKVSFLTPWQVQQESQGDGNQTACTVQHSPEKSSNKPEQGKSHLCGSVSIIGLSDHIYGKISVVGLGNMTKNISLFVYLLAIWIYYDISAFTLNCFNIFVHLNKSYFSRMRFYLMAVWHCDVLQVSSPHTHTLTTSDTSYHTADFLCCRKNECLFSFPSISPLFPSKLRFLPASLWLAATNLLLALKDRFAVLQVFLKTTAHWNIPSVHTDY